MNDSLVPGDHLLTMHISAKVKLSNNMVLFTQQVGKNLALVCVARRESWNEPRLVERNVGLFREALNEVRLVKGEAGDSESN